tara:strand:+ start:10187 stop:10363 length:177 start_codon:yes stop_codon:yes gene_type:complete
VPIEALGSSLSVGSDAAELQEARLLASAGSQTVGERWKEIFDPASQEKEPPANWGRFK